MSFTTNDHTLSGSAASSTACGSHIGAIATIGNSSISPVNVPAVSASVPRGSERPPESFKLGEHAPVRSDTAFPFLAQLDRPRRSIQQLVAGPLLEKGDCAAHSGGRAAKPPPCRSQTPLVDRDDKYFHCIEAIHAISRRKRSVRLTTPSSYDNSSSSSQKAMSRVRSDALDVAAGVSIIEVSGPGAPLPKPRRVCAPKVETFYGFETLKVNKEGGVLFVDIAAPPINHSAALVLAILFL
jgi:hypothetical protein